MTKRNTSVPSVPRYDKLHREPHSRMLSLHAAQCRLSQCQCNAWGCWPAYARGCVAQVLALASDEIEASECGDIMLALEQVQRGCFKGYPEATGPKCAVFIPPPEVIPAPPPKKRGRPRKHPLPEPVPGPEEESEAGTPTAVAAAPSAPKQPPAKRNKGASHASVAAAAAAAAAATDAHTGVTQQQIKDAALAAMAASTNPSSLFPLYGGNMGMGAALTSGHDASPQMLQLHMRQQLVQQHNEYMMMFQQQQQPQPQQGMKADATVSPSPQLPSPGFGSMSISPLVSTSPMALHPGGISGSMFPLYPGATSACGHAGPASASKGASPLHHGGQHSGSGFFVSPPSGSVGKQQQQQQPVSGGAQRAMDPLAHLQPSSHIAVLPIPHMAPAPASVPPAAHQSTTSSMSGASLSSAASPFAQRRVVALIPQKLQMPEVRVQASDLPVFPLDEDVGLFPPLIPSIPAPATSPANGSSPLPSSSDLPL